MSNNKIYYDDELGIEIFSLKGYKQSFPNHFHDYYVIGFVSHGERIMICNNKEYQLMTGDIIIFNPNDSHSCNPKEKENAQFSYYGINITVDSMQELLSIETLPQFSANVIRDDELSITFRDLLDKAINKKDLFLREESLHLLLSILTENYVTLTIPEKNNYIKQINDVSEYICSNYSKNISLAQLCKVSHMSKSTLIRYFTKIKGITPYRYLQSIRINQAKILLEKGSSVIEVSNKVGFSDQSHFTNSFVSFIGLTPANYKNMVFKKDYET